MEETQTPEPQNPQEPQKKCGCPDCERRARKDADNEEIGLAFLLALFPMIVITLFGQIGLF